MSFFNDTNKVGLAFIIVAILQMIGGLATIILGAISDDYELVPSVITGIGSIICALLMFIYGKKVKDGVISQKIDILAEFVKVIGVVTIVGGIFGAIAEAAGDAGIGSAIISAIISIIFGLIILFIASKINDGKQTTGDKIIWIILLIAFIICLIMAIVEIISIAGIITGICHLIIYIFMILLLTDKEVKAEMGM